VFDAKTISAILKSSDFAVTDFAEIHRELEQRVGIDFSALIDVFEISPTSNEGARHRKARADMARLVFANADANKDRTARVVRDLVAAQWHSGSRIDLVQDFVVPVCDELFAGFLGAPVCPVSSKNQNDVSASQIFDLYLGLNRRRRINDKAAEMRDAFAANKTLKTTPTYAVALSMVGYDSIAGTLGCSLLHVLQNNEGDKLREIAFPDELPATGVPYIERFANRDCTVEGAHIKQGDRVRLYLDAGSPDEAGDRPYFGKGRHSCVGEEFSTWLWRTIAAELSRLPLACSIESATRRKPDWVFNYYSSIVVRLDG
jgi:cytochrome P450